MSANQYRGELTRKRKQRVEAWSADLRWSVLRSSRGHQRLADCLENTADYPSPRFALGLPMPNDLMSEQRQRDDRNAIGSPVRFGPGSDKHHIFELRT